MLVERESTFIFVHTHTLRDVGIICVIVYDDLALKAWTQREREREIESEYNKRKEAED